MCYFVLFSLFVWAASYRSLFTGCSKLPFLFWVLGLLGTVLQLYLSYDTDWSYDSNLIAELSIDRFFTIVE